MTSANVSSDSSDGAVPTRHRACPAPTKGAAPDGRATGAAGCHRPVVEPQSLPDPSQRAAPSGLDQARLGEEPHPMLPGLEGC
jgi:hypothetical protein